MRVILILCLQDWDHRALASVRIVKAVVLRPNDCNNPRSENNKIQGKSFLLSPPLALRQGPGLFAQWPIKRKLKSGFFSPALLLTLEGSGQTLHRVALLHYTFIRLFMQLYLFSGCFLLVCRSE